MRILLKDANDELEAHDWTPGKLIDWFKGHTNKAGDVLGDIIVFTEVHIDRAEDGSIEAMFAKGNGPLMTMSDYTLDRDWERIDPKGWDISAYKANPVLLWQHEYFTPAIGHMEDVKVRSGKLSGRPVFDTKEVDPLAWMIGEKMASGTLSAGSVGFCSRKVELIDDPKDKTRLIHRKQELFEFSIVNVPSNPAVTIDRAAEPTPRRLVGPEIETTTTWASTDERSIVEIIHEIEAKLDTILQAKMWANYDPTKQMGLPIEKYNGIFEPRETSAAKRGRETSDLRRMFDQNEPEVANGS